MGLSHVLGPIGSGKTLFTLHAMETAWKQGRPIYTNIELTPKCPYYKHAVFIDDENWPVADEKRKSKDAMQFYWEYVLPGSVVVIDEADLWFDSRKHAGFEDHVVHFHKQLRKMDLDLYYITQRLTSLYVRVRDMAAEYIICDWNYRTDRVVRWLGKDWSRFWHVSYTSPKCRATELNGSGYYTWEEAKRFFGWYSTRQVFAAGGAGTWVARMQERARKGRSLSLDLGVNHDKSGNVNGSIGSSGFGQANRGGGGRGSISAPVPASVEEIPGARGGLLGPSGSSVLGVEDVVCPVRVDGFGDGKFC